MKLVYLLALAAALAWLVDGQFMGQRMRKVEHWPVHRTKSRSRHADVSTHFSGAGAGVRNELCVII